MYENYKILIKRQCVSNQITSKYRDLLTNWWPIEITNTIYSILNLQITRSCSCEKSRNIIKNITRVKSNCIEISRFINEPMTDRHNEILIKINATVTSVEWKYLHEISRLVNKIDRLYLGYIPERAKNIRKVWMKPLQNESFGKTCVKYLRVLRNIPSLPSLARVIARVAFM